MNIIGGADGPTSIFLAGKVGWINFFGLIIMVLILIPNILYAVKFREAKNNCQNKIMNITEQVGRYGSMFLMVFNIGIAELGFFSPEAFVTYLFGNIILLLVYWVIMVLHIKKPGKGKALALAIIPTAIFLMCGITLGHILLIISGVIFGIGHIYVTNENAKEFVERK